MSTGAGSSGSSKQVSTVSSAPWSGQQSYLTDLFSNAKGLTHNTDGSIKPIQQYPGQTYAGMAPESSQALTSIAARANAGSPITTGADQFAGDVLGGKYLNQGNPNFQAVAQKATDAVNGNYGAYGRSNSGMHDSAVAGAVGNIAYNDYTNQLNLMNSVLGQSPQLAAADYADATQLGNVGAARQQEGQNQITDAESKWNAQQQAPYDALKAYQDFISGTYGGTSQTTQPIYNTPAWQQYLGAGIGAAGTAASLYSAFA